MSVTDREKDDRIWRRVIIVASAVVLLAVAIGYGRKVSHGGSAFVRWRPQVVELVQGVDVYEKHEYPNTPVVAIALYPFALLPPMAGAMLLFAIKTVMAVLAVWWAIDMAIGRRRAPPVWVIGVVVLLSARPIIADLQHGNINILIMFLVLGACRLFTRDRTALAGVVVGIATVVKVTPGLFMPYFLWKRQWRALAGCGAGLLLGVLLPIVMLGWSTNVRMHQAWYGQMIAPFLGEGGTAYPEHINQALPGVVYRWCTDSVGLDLPDGRRLPVNVVSLDPSTANTILRVLTLATLGWLAFVCRTRVTDRRDWRLACEFGLVLLAMLILSERTWKHHFVTVVMPVASLVMYLALAEPGRAMRRTVLAALIGFFLLTVCTSGELIGWMYQGVAHKYAEAAGSFFFAAVLLGAALSALLISGRRRARKAAATPNGRDGRDGQQ